MNEIKKYKLDRIHAFIGDDEEMLKKMVAIFLKNSPELLSLIQENLKQKDYSKLEFHAHKLKTSIDHFSIESITSEIRQIEKYARERINIDQLPGLIQKLEIELQESIREIKKDFNLE